MIGNGKIFISHTHADNQRCDPLLAALDAWQADYWFDLTELSAGLVFGENITEAIRQRSIFLRVCTENTAGSAWMTREAELAHQFHPSGNGKQSAFINLILTPGYTPTAQDHGAIVIDTTHQTEVAWVRELRQTLGIPPRDRGISRRTAIGLGATTLAAIGATGYAAKLATTPAPAPHTVYRPAGVAQNPPAQAAAARVRWFYQNGIAAPETFTADPSRIAVAQNRIFNVMNQTLSALATADGALQWTADPNQNGYQNAINNYGNFAPTVAGGILYVAATYEPVLFGDNKPLMVTYDVATGKERWRTVLPYSDPTNPADVKYLSSVTVDDDLAFICLDSQVFAIDAATGKTRWQSEIGLPYPQNFILRIPPPVVAGGVVYAALTNGKLRAFDRQTGLPLDGGQPLLTSPLPFLSAPTVVGATLYQTGCDGYCSAIDLTTRGLRWKKPLVTDTELTNISYNFSSKETPFVPSSPTVMNGVIYISGGDYDALGDHFVDRLIALDATTGKTLWNVQPSNDLISSKQVSRTPSTPLVVGGRIYIAAVWETQTSRQTDVLYACDATSGNVLWSYQMRGNAPIAGQPTIVGDTLYYPSTGGAIYSFNLS
jgi:outer membrane protein assembly factor BamB